MSKKKVSGASSTTMTLKDFHGGSIPSDLLLPSAPGLITRPSDRPGGSWANPSGRSDHNRLRPGSAGAVRNFDVKTPILSPGVNIGRNFDEDERKPLDGASGPRRTFSDESIRALPTRAELKPDYSSTGRLASSSANSYAGRVVEATHVDGNSQDFGGNSSYSGRFAEAANSGQAAGMYPNVWAIRKEAVSATEPLPATWSGPNVVSKLAHASALDKVSSGRWQSKQSVHQTTDVEAIRQTSIESEFNSKGERLYNKSSYHTMDLAGGVEYHDAMLVRQEERSLTVEDGNRGRGVGSRELPKYERTRSPIFPETKGSNPQRFVDGVQPVRNDGKFVGSELQSPGPSDQLERPKLKLLPRSKPLESSEPPVDYKQGYQQPYNSDHLENVTEYYVKANPIKYGLAGSESSDTGNQVVERPKLNLKPRSQPLEQTERNIKGGRNTVFGGARPRELVLRERGIDDVFVDDHDISEPPIRVKQDVPRIETVPTHATPTRYGEKGENSPLDNRIRKNNDRRDNRVDVERTDMQRRNSRNDNWRNNRENEKHQHQQQKQPQERPASPETWRKPAEQPKPASPDGPGLRYGKAASAVDLAQAFSRSVSEPKTADRFPGQSGIPGRAQVPFSRLMDPTSRPQINGY